MTCVILAPVFAVCDPEGKAWQSGEAGPLCRDVPAVLGTAGRSLQEFSPLDLSEH